MVMEFPFRISNSTIYATVHSQKFRSRLKTYPEFARESQTKNKQKNKQTNKQTNKQKNKQTNKQTNKKNKKNTLEYRTVAERKSIFLIINNYKKWLLTRNNSYSVISGNIIENHLPLTRIVSKQSNKGCRR